MKKQKRTQFLCIKSLLSLVVAFSFLLLASCESISFYNKNPSNFPDTTWSTKDGTITFSVGEERTIFEYEQVYKDNGKEKSSLVDMTYCMFGTITMNNQEYEFYIALVPGSSMSFISTKISELQETRARDYFELIMPSSEYNLVYLEGVNCRKKRFSGKVKGGTLFENDTELKFYRVDSMINNLLYF